MASGSKVTGRHHNIHHTHVYACWCCCCDNGGRHNIPVRLGFECKPQHVATHCYTHAPLTVGCLEHKTVYGCLHLHCSMCTCLPVPHSQSATVYTSHVLGLTFGLCIQASKARLHLYFCKAREHAEQALSSLLRTPRAPQRRVPCTEWLLFQGSALHWHGELTDKPSRVYVLRRARKWSAGVWRRLRAFYIRP